jgi:2-oxoisovalerate dehydrogenase E1 component alpha subunit
MKKNGLYDEKRTADLRLRAKTAVRDSLKASSLEKLPKIDELFNDVYDELPLHLAEQKEHLRSHLKSHPDVYGIEKFEGSEDFIRQ